MSCLCIRDLTLSLKNHFGFFSLHRRYGPRCSGCQNVILPNDMVRKARERIFHLTCFTCVMCKRQLNTGDKLFVMMDGAFVCKDDYITHVLNNQSNNVYFYGKKSLVYSRFKRQVDECRTEPSISFISGKTMASCQIGPIKLSLNIIVTQARVWEHVTNISKRGY